METNVNHKTYKMKLFEDLIIESAFGMPLQPIYKGEIPCELLSFNKAVAQKRYDTTVHFYINDKEFTRILT